MVLINMAFTIDELEVEHLLDSDCRSTCLVVHLLEVFLIELEHILLLRMVDWLPLVILILSELDVFLDHGTEIDLLHSEGRLLLDCSVGEFLKSIHEKRSVHA